MQVFDRRAIAGTTRGQINTVDHVDGLPGLVYHPKPAVASHGAPILVSGWSVDPATNAAPQAVIVLLDRVRELTARVGIARGDIMVEFATDEFVGFQLSIDTTDLGAGSHELRVYSLGSDGFWYESGSAGFRLFHNVIPAKEQLTRPIRMALDGRVDLTSGKHLTPESPVRGNHWVQLQGWTYDVATQTAAARIAAIDEHGRMWSGPSAVERPDAGAAMLANHSQFGFEIVVPGAVFARGRHVLHIVGFDDSGRRYANAIAVPMNIISEAHRFPLTARCLSQPAVVGGLLKIFAPTESSDANGTESAAGDDDEPALVTRELPAGDLSVDSGALMRIDGWALEAGGAAADDVFLELRPRWATVPPQRIAADSGWITPEFEANERPNAGDVEGSFFTALLNSADLRAGTYDLAIVVVQPDRCSYAIAPIATLTVRPSETS